MLLTLENINSSDPGIIFVCVIFSISFLSCLIGLGIYLYKKCKKNKIQKQLQDREYYNL